MARIEDGSLDSSLALPWPLDEFVTALQEEIEAAKRYASSAAVPLTDGRQIAKLGQAVQYAFLMDSVLNVPGDMPGDLRVPGKGTFQTTIVSVEGLRIVISIEADLGQFVPTATLQTDLTLLLRKLIGRITLNATKTNDAALRMLGKSPVCGKPQDAPDIPAGLFNAQKAAVRSALGRNLTVIWGPPGTGKTRTIGSIAQCLFNSGRSVLVVSHTNIAVDQAIRHVAEALKEQVDLGKIIRIGEVHDEKLRNTYPGALLKTQVERQSCELSAKKDQLVARKVELSKDISSLEREAAVAEWAAEAPPVIQLGLNNLAVLDSKEAELSYVEKELERTSESESALTELLQRAENLLFIRKAIALRNAEKIALQERLSGIETGCQLAHEALEESVRRLEIALRIEPLRIELASCPSLPDLRSSHARLSERLVAINHQIKGLQHRLDEELVILQHSLTTGRVARLLKRVPEPHEQTAVVDNLRKRLAGLEGERIAILSATESLQNHLARVLELDSRLANYPSIATLQRETAKEQEARAAFNRVREGKQSLEAELSEIELMIRRLNKLEQAEAAAIGEDPESCIDKARAALQRLRQMQCSQKSLHLEIQRLKDQLSSTLSVLLKPVFALGLINEIPSAITAMLQCAVECQKRVNQSTSLVTPIELRGKAASLRAMLVDVARSIQEIELQLSQVEKNIIANAAIIGATLTKTYLSEEIQACKFDTVILDEASMASFPALWVAALLCQRSLVVVGDPRQLGPVVLSQRELARKWLGYEIISKDLESKEYFIKLTEQLRMVREIVQVANLFYDNELRGAAKQDTSLWFNRDWPYDKPVVLVDTGPLNAWVTSVAKNGKASRLNFLSASVSVDIAAQLILPEALDASDRSPKVLIVSPYRPHAKLVSLLLSENATLKDHVVAGTAHSFQGSEAEVVIFDLVADEPHWRVNLFNPKRDQDMRRLLNVGLTRAKSRLIIIGDFAYNLKRAKRAFLGKTLLPHLMKAFPPISALKVVPEGLAGRAAKAQIDTMGGEIEPAHSRLRVTQQGFFPLLLSDIQQAKQRVIIYSPFMTQARVGYLLPQLQAALERGVKISVITKPLSERTKPKGQLEHAKLVEKQLSVIGVNVVHKMRMHEKLVFVDDDITWVGSLNPLSFSDTQEIMDRTKSQRWLEGYFQILRLDELLSTPGKPESKCPVCGAEMMAVEGRDEPYFWQCANKCFTRSIGADYPLDGILRCTRCDTPYVFSFSGSEPYWVCPSDGRHKRQKVRKSHLRLPKMRALIPNSIFTEVCTRLRIDAVSATARHHRQS